MTGSVEKPSPPMNRNAVVATVLSEVQRMLPRLPVRAGKMNSAQCPEGGNRGTFTALGIRVPFDSSATQVMAAGRLACMFATVNPVKNGRLASAKLVASKGTMKAELPEVDDTAAS